jgi:hypothetical protein
MVLITVSPFLSQESRKHFIKKEGRIAGTPSAFVGLVETCVA